MLEINELTKYTPHPLFAECIKKWDLDSDLFFSADIFSDAMHIPDIRKCLDEIEKDNSLSSITIDDIKSFNKRLNADSPVKIHDLVKHLAAAQLIGLERACSNEKSRSRTIPLRAERAICELTLRFKHEKLENILNNKNNGQLPLVDQRGIFFFFRGISSQIAFSGLMSVIVRKRAKNKISEHAILHQIDTANRARAFIGIFFHLLGIDVKNLPTIHDCRNDKEER